MAGNRRESLPNKSKTKNATLTLDLKEAIDRAKAQAEGSKDLEDLFSLLSFESDLVRDAAQREADRENADDDEPIELIEVLARRFKELRKESGQTQERIADAMAYLGFGWNRTTVVEIERFRRGIALIEAFALAALFGIPAARFFLPKDTERVWMPKEWDAGPPDEIGLGGGIREGRALSGKQMAELLLGPGGSVAAGGADWQLARAVALVTRRDGRPAVALWNARRGASEHGHD
jgi:transcriptional regulator with XRE-family HTH domain